MFTYTIIHTQTVQIEQKFHHPNLKLALNIKFAELSLYGADSWT